MRDAQYLHAQAELCLELARQMSNPKTIENLKAEAVRYHAEAVDVEAAGQPESPGHSRIGVKQHWQKRETALAEAR